MRHNRLDRIIPLLVIVAATAAPAATAIELLAAADGVRIDVSDDAPPVVEVAGDAIVPGRWTRGGRTRATLPLVLLPVAPAASLDLAVAGEARSFAVDVSLARITIDPAAYAAPPRPAAGRWAALATTAALSLLLASRVRPEQRGTIAVGIIAIAWAAGLTAFGATRPDVESRTIGDVTWLRARRATVARVDVGVPIVESASHLRSLSPRIAVDAEGRATLELTLARGARVVLRPIP